MRILVQYTNAVDGCAHYRSIGPYSLLAKMHPELTVTFREVPTYYEIRTHDVVIFHRPWNQELLMALKACRDYEVPFIVDFDDDFFSIPKDNPVAHLYTKENLENVEMIIRMSPMLFVSTSHLLRQFSKFNENIEVIPNALDDALIKYRGNAARNKLVLWRGTRTHDRDVASVATELVTCANKYQHHKFLFMGSNPCPWLVTEEMKNVEIDMRQLEPMMFFQTMIQYQPKILIAPLADNKFNKSKSNIAAIEGTLAGAAILAPAWEEWEFPGVVTYDDARDFGSKLEDMIQGTIKLQEHVNAAWNHVLSELRLATVNQRRLELIRKVVGK